MDIGAFVQIEGLEYILKEQNIEIPRLRGLRLMKDEKPVSPDSVEDEIKEAWLNICTSIIEQGSLDIWSSWKAGTRNDILIRRVVPEDKYGHKEVVGVRWDKVHGKKRKWIKFEFKKTKKEILKQYNTFNKYVGQNVLMVHARIGGFNWDYYEGYKLLDHPDFLERVDDSSDGTYCDIYFKLHKEYQLIEPEETEEDGDLEELEEI